MTKPINKNEISKIKSSLEAEIDILREKLKFLENDGRTIEAANVRYQIFKTMSDNKNSGLTKEEEEGIKDLVKKLDEANEEFKEAEKKLKEEITTKRNSLKEEREKELAPAKQAVETEKEEIKKVEVQIKKQEETIKNQAAIFGKTKKDKIAKQEYNSKGDDEKKELVNANPEVLEATKELAKVDPLHKYSDLIKALKEVPGGNGDIDRAITLIKGAELTLENAKAANEVAITAAGGGVVPNDLVKKKAAFDELAKVSGHHNNCDQGLELFRSDVINSSSVSVKLPDVVNLNPITAPADAELNAVRDAMANLDPSCDRRNITLENVEEGLRRYRKEIIDPKKAKTSNPNSLAAINAVKKLESPAAANINEDETVNLVNATKILDAYFPPVERAKMDVPENLHNVVNYPQNFRAALAELGAIGHAAGNAAVGLDNIRARLSQNNCNNLHAANIAVNPFNNVNIAAALGALGALDPSGANNRDVGLAALRAAVAKNNPEQANKFNPIDPVPAGIPAHVAPGLDSYTVQQRAALTALGNVNGAAGNAAVGLDIIRALLSRFNRNNLHAADTTSFPFNDATAVAALNALGALDPNGHDNKDDGLAALRVAVANNNPEQANKFNPIDHAPAVIVVPPAGVDPYAANQNTLPATNADKSKMQSFMEVVAKLDPSYDVVSQASQKNFEFGLRKFRDFVRDNGGEYAVNISNTATYNGVTLDNGERSKFKDVLTELRKLEGSNVAVVDNTGITNNISNVMRLVNANFPVLALAVPMVAFGAGYSGLNSKEQKVIDALGVLAAPPGGGNINDGVANILAVVPDINDPKKKVSAEKALEIISVINPAPADIEYKRALIKALDDHTPGDIGAALRAVGDRVVFPAPAPAPANWVAPTGIDRLRQAVTSANISAERKTTNIISQEERQKIGLVLNALAVIPTANPQEGLEILREHAEEAGFTGPDQLSKFLKKKPKLIRGGLTATEQEKTALQQLANLSDSKNPDEGLRKLQEILLAAKPDLISLEESVIANDNSEEVATAKKNLEEKKKNIVKQYEKNGVPAFELDVEEMIDSDQKIIDLRRDLEIHQKALEEKNEIYRRKLSGINSEIEKNPEINDLKNQIKEEENKLHDAEKDFETEAADFLNGEGKRVKPAVEEKLALGMVKNNKEKNETEAIIAAVEYEIQTIKEVEIEINKTSPSLEEVNRLMGNKGYNEKDKDDFSKGIIDSASKIAGAIYLNKDDEVDSVINNFKNQNGVSDGDYEKHRANMVFGKNNGKVLDFSCSIKKALSKDLDKDKVPERLEEILESGSEDSKNFYSEAVVSIVENKLKQKNPKQLSYLNAKVILELSSQGKNIDEEEKLKAQEIVNAGSAFEPVKGSLADLYYRAALRGGKINNLNLNVLPSVGDGQGLGISDSNSTNVLNQIEDGIEDKEEQNKKGAAAKKIGNFISNSVENKKLREELEEIKKTLQDIRNGGQGIGTNPNMMTALGNGTLQSGVPGQIPNGAFSYSGAGASNFSPTILVRNDGRGGVERRITLPDGVTSAWVHVDPHEMIGNDAIRMGDKIYEVKSIDSGRNSPNSVASFPGQGNGGSNSSQGSGVGDSNSNNGNSNSNQSNSSNTNGSSGSDASDKHDAINQAVNNQAAKPVKSKGEVTIEEAKEYINKTVESNRNSKLGRMVDGLNGSVINDDNGCAEIKDNGMVVIKYHDLSALNEDIKNIRGKLSPSGIIGDSKSGSFASIVEVEVDGKPQYKIVASDKAGVRVFDLDEAKYKEIIIGNAEEVMSKVISEYAERGKAGINEDMKKNLLTQCDNELRTPGRIGGRKDKLKDVMKKSGFSISDENETVVERHRSDSNSVCVTINNGSTKDAFISLGHDAYVKVDAASGKVVPDTIFIKNGKDFEEVNISGGAFRLPLSYHGVLGSGKLAEKLVPKGLGDEGVREAASDIMENYNNLKVIVCKGEFKGDKYNVSNLSFQVDGKTHGLRLEEGEKIALGTAAGLVAGVLTGGLAAGVGLIAAAAPVAGGFVAGAIEEFRSEGDISREKFKLGKSVEEKYEEDMKGIGETPSGSASQPITAISMKGRDKGVAASAVV